MTRQAPEGFVRKVMAFPEGSFCGTVGAQRYVATRTTFAGGKSLKLVAEELGGPDYISLNLYMLDGGAQLFPCEMPASKVIAFVEGLVPDQDVG
jgi:hypothetical protein